MQSHSLDSLIEMQSSSSSPLPVPVRLSFAQACVRGQFKDALNSALASLQLTSLKPKHSLSNVESGVAMDDTAHPTPMPAHDSTLDPEQVQICCNAFGDKIILGKGGFGVVSLP